MDTGKLKEPCVGFGTWSQYNGYSTNLVMKLADGLLESNKRLLAISKLTVEKAGRDSTLAVMPSTHTKSISQPVEIKKALDVSDVELQGFLNDGWGILMQELRFGKINVVLKRDKPDEKEPDISQITQVDRPTPSADEGDTGEKLEAGEVRIEKVAAEYVPSADYHKKVGESNRKVIRAMLGEDSA